MSTRHFWLGAVAVKSWSMMFGAIGQVIEMEPDLTLFAVAQRLLAETGMKADADMLSRFLTGNGISFKKKRLRLRAAPA